MGDTSTTGRGTLRLSHYGYAGLGYAGVGHAVVATTAGLVHSSHVGLCTNAWGAAVPCLGKKKREAEAEAEAEAEPYVGLGYAGLGYAGLGYSGLGHAVVGTHAGLIHSSHVGLCTNNWELLFPAKKLRCDYSWG